MRAQALLKPRTAAAGECALMLHGRDGSLSVAIEMSSLDPNPCPPMRCVL